MTRIILVVSSGALFGLGLCVSQMVNPAKVLAFLDLTGAWDPSLALVMLGAVGVAAVGFPLAMTMRKPLFGGTFPAPSIPQMDGKLIFGALIFGIGWGIVGFCPGPAIASLVYGSPKSWLFLASMVGGMLAARPLLQRTSR